YVEHEQKGLAGLAKELGEALQKDLSHLGSNAREQLEKLRNSLSLPRGYQLAGVPHMGNEASYLFKNMSKELKESLDGLKSKLDNVMKSSSGGSGGKPPGSKGTVDVGTPPRYGDRRISDTLYKKIRRKTPSKELQDTVNEGVQLPMDDPVLRGKKITSRLEPDHIVSLDNIARMENYDKLTFEQQVKVANNRENFIGLSRSANGSKQNKTYEQWTHYKKGTPDEIEVDPVFRKKMMEREKEMEKILQKQIDDMANQNRQNGG
ncbi:hypothetical protein, partial [Paenibacillus dendritiformis]